LATGFRRGQCRFLPICGHHSTTHCFPPIVAEVFFLPFANYTRFIPPPLLAVVSCFRQRSPLFSLFHPPFTSRHSECSMHALNPFCLGYPLLHRGQSLVCISAIRPLPPFPFFCTGQYPFCCLVVGIGFLSRDCVKYTRLVFFYLYVFFLIPKPPEPYPNTRSRFSSSPESPLEPTFQATFRFSPSLTLTPPPPFRVLCLTLHHESRWEYILAGNVVFFRSLPPAPFLPSLCPSTQDLKSPLISHAPPSCRLAPLCPSNLNESTRNFPSVSLSPATFRFGNGTIHTRGRDPLHCVAPPSPATANPCQPPVGRVLPPFSSLLASL